MKKATTILAGLVIVIGSAAFAEGTETGEAAAVKIVPAKAETYNLFYKGAKEGAVKVKIYAESGRLIFTDFVKTDGKFIRPYSFEALPEGNYKIEVVDANGTVSTEIEHLRPEAVGIVDVALKPVSAEKSYELKVRGEEFKPVSVRIYDRYGRLVTEDYITIDTSFKRVYNLKNIASDSFVFEVASDSRLIKKASL